MRVQFHTASDEGPGVFEFVRGSYTSAVITLSDESTNQDSRLALESSPEVPSPIEGTMAYAVARYDQLLRKLAD